jgi:hypothetical protein
VGIHVGGGLSGEKHKFRLGLLPLTTLVDDQSKPCEVWAESPLVGLEILPRFVRSSCIVGIQGRIDGENSTPLSSPSMDDEVVASVRQEIQIRGRLHPFPGYHYSSHVEIEEGGADYVSLPYTGKNTNNFKMLPDTKVD